MRIESPYRNRDAGLQAELFRPVRRERSSDLIRRRVFTIELFANSCQQRVHFGEEPFRRQAPELAIPQPLVSHGANTALYFLRIGDAAEGGGNHVAML